MTQVQTEQLLAITADGRKIVLVTLTGLVLSGSVQEVLLGDLEEVVAVFGATTPTPTLISGVVTTIGAGKSSVNPKNGVTLMVSKMDVTSGGVLWTAAVTADVAATTFEFLAFGI